MSYFKCVLLVFGLLGAALGQDQLATNGPIGPNATTPIIVTLSPSTVAAGSTSHMSAQMQMDDNSLGAVLTQQVIWTSSNTGVATVSIPPAVTTPTTNALSAGTTTITATYGTYTGTATLTVSNPPLITSPSCGGASNYCVLSNGVQGSAYSGFTPAQSGGTAPIVWSISPGSLPTGLSINSSTGAITGTPSVAATSNFTILETANNGTATQNASITISATGGCGFSHAFPCSATNVTAATNISTASAPFTGIGGMGRYVATPCPGCPGSPAIDNAPIYQLTDETLAYGVSAHKTMGVNCDGNAFARVWSQDEKHLATCDSGNGIYFWNNTLGPPFSSVLAFKGASNMSQPAFSTTNNFNRYYYFTTANPTKIVYSDVTDNTQAQTTLIDFATANGWSSALGIKHTDSPIPNFGDTLWADGFSATGTQGTGRLMVAYVAPGGFVATGIYLVNLSTTAMYGPSGFIGNYNVAHGTQKIHQVATCNGNCVILSTTADKFTLSNLTCGTVFNGVLFVSGVSATYTTLSDGTIPLAGESFTISGTTNYNGTFTVNQVNSGSTTLNWQAACTDAPPESSATLTIGSDHGADPFVWIPGQSDLGVECVSLCGGHWVAGQTNFINDANTSTTFVAKSLTSPGTNNFTFPTVDPCVGHQAPWDTHLSIPPTGTDTANWVFVSSSSDTTAEDFTKPCTQEAMGYLFSGTTTAVKRFALQWSDLTWHFNTYEFIMNGSPLGNFLDLSSNMGSSLGDGNGSPTCTKGTTGGGAYGKTGGTCSNQVFVVDLRQQ